ncbi:MAG TPA: hypothetical protein VHE30_06005 [Polyangiaceae bacterium]|nr:hypothetical protein [Polyangiaceae bacterium]
MTRVLGVEPVVPLALVSDWMIREAGKGCCVPFSETKGYYAVDRWGKTTGPFKLGGYEEYDATECRELYFENAPNNPILYVSESLEERASPMTISPELHAEIDHLLPEDAKDVGSEYMRDSAKSLEDYRWSRAMAFEWRTAAGVQRYVAVGGDALVVFRIEEHPKQLCVIDENLRGFPQYRPTGVAQLDTTPEPELVFLESEGASWDTAIVTLGPDRCEWRAASVGGSTA